MNNAAKDFGVLATNLNVLRNYFDSPNKIIFKSKFLDTSAKSFFRVLKRTTTRATSSFV